MTLYISQNAIHGVLLAAILVFLLGACESAIHLRGRRTRMRRTRARQKLRTSQPLKIAILILVATAPVTHYVTVIIDLLITFQSAG
jgi:hypothetical protein